MPISVCHGQRRAGFDSQNSTVSALSRGAIGRLLCLALSLALVFSSTTSKDQLKVILRRSLTPSRSQDTTYAWRSVLFFMIVNLPEEAAWTICFSIDSLILLDSCYEASAPLFHDFVEFLRCGQGRY